MEPTCALYILDPALPVWRLHYNSMQQRMTVSERIPTDSSVEYFFPETAVLWADLFFQSHQGTMTSFAAACSAIDSFPQEIVCFFIIVVESHLMANFSPRFPPVTPSRHCNRGWCSVGAGAHSIRIHLIPLSFWVPKVQTGWTFVFWCNRFHLVQIPNGMRTLGQGCPQQTGANNAHCCLLMMSTPRQGPVLT